MVINKVEKFIKALKPTFYEMLTDKITWFRYIIAAIFVYFSHLWWINDPFTNDAASDARRFTIILITILYISTIVERTIKKIK